MQTSEEIMQQAIDAANVNPVVLTLTDPEQEWFDEQWNQAKEPHVFRALANVDRAAQGLSAVADILEYNERNVESAANSGVTYQSLSRNQLWGLWQAHKVLLGGIIESLERIRERNSNT